MKSRQQDQQRADSWSGIGRLRLRLVMQVATQARTTTEMTMTMRPKIRAQLMANWRSMVLESMVSL
jgi:hypothetical protein